MNKYSSIRSFWFAFIIFAEFSAQGQKNVLDKIILENGVELYGVLDSLSADSVILIIGKNQKIILPKNLIINHQHIPNKSFERHKKPYKFREKGFFQKFEGGLLLPNSGNETGLFVGYSLGYSFHRLFRLGIGTGIDYSNGRDYIPLFLDLASYISRDNATLFVGLKAGYLIELGERSNVVDSQRHYFFNPKLGVRLSANDNFNSEIALGLRWDYDNIDYVAEYWLSQRTRKTIQVTLGYQLSF